MRPAILDTTYLEGLDMARKRKAELGIDSWTRLTGG